MAPTLGGGTQDTDFNKGFTKGMFTKNLRRRNGGGQGDPDTLITKERRKMTVSKQSGPFLAGTRTKAETPKKNKVRMIIILYFYRAVPCTSIEDF